MIKKITAMSKAQKVTASSDDSTARRPIDRDSLIDAVETERQRIFRARVIAQTAAKLLHELYVPKVVVWFSGSFTDTRFSAAS